METVYQIEDLLEQTITRTISSVYVTGSRLYGVHTDDSDLDLLIYVFPTKEDIALNKMIRKDVTVNKKIWLSGNEKPVMIEKVTVIDVRYLMNDISKPSFNSLHLIHPPLLGVGIFKYQTLLDAFNARRKNIILSTQALIRKQLSIDKQNTQARAAVLQNACLYAIEHGFKLNFFNAPELKEKRQEIKQLREQNMLVPNTQVTEQLLISETITQQMLHEPKQDNSEVYNRAKQELIDSLVYHAILGSPNPYTHLM